MKNPILAYNAMIGSCYLVVAPAFVISIILSLYEVRNEIQILIVTTKFQIITPNHEDKPNINAYGITENISMFVGYTSVYSPRMWLYPKKSMYISSQPIACLSLSFRKTCSEH